LIEDKANGSAVIQELKHELPGLIAVHPEGGKVARAHAVSAQVDNLVAERDRLDRAIQALQKLQNGTKNVTKGFMHKRKRPL
jgi:hypothetical protein